MFDENGNYVGEDNSDNRPEDNENYTAESSEENSAPGFTQPETGGEYSNNAHSYGADENPIYTDSEQAQAEDVPADTEPQPDYVEARQVNEPQSGYQSQYGGYQGQAGGYASQTPPPYQSASAPYYGSYNQPPVQEPEKPKKNGKKVFISIIALVLVFALGMGFASLLGKSKRGGLSNGKESVTGDTAELTIADTPTAKAKSSANGALTPAQIAEKVRASNVGIVVYSSRNSSSATGEGSGIIMGEDSTKTYTYIITCAHVVDTAGVKVAVQTEDGQSYDAEIVGYDIRTDIGVVKIKKTGLQAAEFGNSDKLVIGDPVYAVGNPGGVEFFGSFTGGFISAINRPVSSEIGYTMKCIQHDAAINPGNSGGMLINQYGQVIGINSQKIASSSYEGMGFAIPITSAKEIIDDLIQYSYIPDRPKLGITYYPVSASTQYYMIAQLKNLPAGTLIINEISADSSLAHTKAQRYDMIIAVNGKELTTADVLIGMIDNGKVGDKLTLTLCRVNSNYNVETFDVEATLVEDRGETPETTTQQVIDPFEYFYNGGSSNGGSNNPFGFGY